MILPVFTLCAFVVVAVSQTWLNNFLPVGSLILILLGTVTAVEAARVLKYHISNKKLSHVIARKFDPILYLALFFFSLLLAFTFKNEVWLSASSKLLILSILIFIIVKYGENSDLIFLKKSIVICFGGLLILSFFTNQLGLTPDNRGVFNHPNTAAMVSAIALSGTLYIPNSAFRIVVIICAFGIGISSNSLSWFLAGSILLPLKFITLIPMKGTRLAAKAAPIFAIVFSLTPIIIAASPTLFSIARENAEAASSLSRLSVWSGAFEAFVSSPISGRGPDGTFTNYIYSFGIEEQLLYAHNFWLTFLGMGGLVLAIPLTLLFIRIIFFRRDTDTAAPFIVSSIVIFSSVEYALQLDVTTWIVLLIFSIHNASSLDPFKERAGLQPSPFVGSDQSVHLPHRTLQCRPKEV